MALHAGTIRESFFVEDSPDLVGLMAVDTTGNLVRPFLPQFTTNYL
jgi:hypothetical protein